MSALRVSRMPWPLDLDGDRFARRQHRAMDLADRCRRERLRLERPVDDLRDVAQLLAHDLTHLVVRERRHLVEQPEQLVAVGRRQQVVAHRQHLAQLDPGAAEPLEREPHADRSTRRRATPERDRRPDEIGREDRDDLPDPPWMAEQGPHRQVTMRPGPPASGPDVGPSDSGSGASRQAGRGSPGGLSPHPAGRDAYGSEPSRPPIRSLPGLSSSRARRAHRTMSETAPSVAS